MSTIGNLWVFLESLQNPKKNWLRNNWNLSCGIIISSIQLLRLCAIVRHCKQILSVLRRYVLKIVDSWNGESCCYNPTIATMVILISSFYNNYWKHLFLFGWVTVWMTDVFLWTTGYRFCVDIIDSLLAPVFIAFFVSDTLAVQLSCYR